MPSSAPSRCPPGIPGAVGLLRSDGRPARRLVALAGEVVLSRRRFRCGACGGEVMPLDAALALEPSAQRTLDVRLYTSNDERVAALPAFLDHYNHRRPHSALGGMTPMACLVNNVSVNHA